MNNVLVKTTAAAVFSATTMFAASAAHAGTTESVRPGIEIRSVVAKDLASEKSRSGGFQWGKIDAANRATESEAVAETAPFRWDQIKTATSIAVVSATGGDRAVAIQQGFRWGIKSNADQQGFRWGIKSNADQQGFRWGIKSNADQQGFRWGIKSNADQQGFRWGIKSNADQQGFRWGIKSSADQQGFRWGIKVAGATQE